MRVRCLTPISFSTMLDQSTSRFLFDQIPVAMSLNREDDGVYVDVNAEWTGPGDALPERQPEA